MKATTVLVEEHAIIERALDVAEAAVARLRVGQDIPDGYAAWLIDFICQFADGCHHHKEEGVLFPLLEARGVPKQGGPIGCMLHEHELGRDLVRRMKGASQATPFDKARFADALEDYAALLRQHIFKENNVLFLMAERVLTPADDEQAIERYRQIEPQGSPAKCHHKYAAEVAEWGRKLGVATPAVAAR